MQGHAGICAVLGDTWLPSWAPSHGSCSDPQAAYVLSKYQYFVCPVEYRSDVNSFVTECEPSDLFQLQDYALPPFLQAVLSRVGHASR